MKLTEIILTQKINLLLTLLFLLIVILFGLCGCNNENIFWQYAPESISLTPPPQTVDIDILYDEYVSDEIDATKKYNGKRLFFPQVTVEKVGGNWFFILDYVKMHFTSGPAKFKIDDDYFNLMQNIEEGYVLNIAGNCKGLKDGLLLIEDCWVESAGGDLGLD